MTESVTQWLEKLGFGQYVTTFVENDIDWDVLPELDQETLKDIGISSAGDRLRIIKAARSIPVDSSTVEPSEQSARESSEPSELHSEAERRQLTVMFCDLVGSTELSQRLDPEELREVNRAYQDACKAAIERYEGYIARYMGDGVLAYFGYPQAHEDDAERAIHAGLGVIDSVTGLSAAVSDGQDIELAVRVGISTGPVVVGDLIGEGASQESAVVGETPNLAARLQGAATKNTVVIGPRTSELVRGLFECDDLGTQSFKGIAEPVNAWRVIGQAYAESRFEAAHRTGLTPVVGREHEIGLLLERWKQAVEGDGQVVLLSGEAGIGKSRITETLRSRTEEDVPVKLTLQCSPYHTNTVLHPLVEHLRRAAQFDINDTREAKLAKLESLLIQGAPDVSAVAPIFATLLSIPFEDRYPSLDMTGERQKEAILEAAVAQITGLSRNNPVLLIFEDVHWADPTSIDLLSHIIESAQSLPILVVLTFRPEFSSPWIGHQHATSLSLNRFTRHPSSQLSAPELPLVVIFLPSAGLAVW